ncbi:transcriptional regulator with XRE-family HTH domain/tetratricopeptide (TPR) repeat protein [Kribbella italica]|uniref:Transcriptional regulator with XRE-family HTH domain/tetratricopeptide (TPR) repeat protein n=1 Tax=Kribbella italica TaxID=1540520 RepID=A0A7W9JCE0_9ACTN|nr:transcriptional regulator with XRE-family HTH domain/tetratricopeptide (TPR) repeat protein [Kribbella italica]
MTSGPPFAQLLREFRTTTGLTQERLAELAGLSAVAIGALEGGRRTAPRISTVGQLADALRLSRDDRQRLATAARRPNKPRERAFGIPRQLPPAVADFTGRADELRRLVELLRSPHAAAPGIVISSIGGMAGVGKTTLAVQASRRAVDQFPDGQLYLNLRGSGEKPLTPTDALTALMLSLGLPATGIPDNGHATAARYRTALAGRRILLMLDDVASVDQVALLMPGTPGAVVVMTSRHPLTSLPGVRHLALEVMTEAEALQLLTEVVGQPLEGAERETGLDIVRRCGLLPLAIRIAGGRARTTGLDDVAVSLAKHRGRLQLLTGPAAEVGQSIALSLDHLRYAGDPIGSAAAEAFPVLALLDGDRFPLRAAAAVIDRSLDDTEDLLERLVDVHLLETPALHQYWMHDLVRETGRMLAATTLPGSTVADARSRELTCYVSTLWRWEELRGREEVYGSRTGIPWSLGAEDLDDLELAEDWLGSELPNVVRLARTAAPGEAGERLAVVRLALGMLPLSIALMRFAEARATVAAALEHSDGLPEELEFGLFYAAGALASAAGLYEESGRWLRQALVNARRRESAADVAACLIDIGYGLGRLGRPAEGMPLCEEGLAAVVESQLAKFEVGANVAVGSLAGLAGDLERQWTAFDRALTLMSELSAPAPAVIHKSMIGHSYRDSGRYDASAAILRDNLRAVRELGKQVLEADVLIELGTTLLASGDLAEAERTLRTGLELAARFPEENREAALLQPLGQVLAAQGSPTEATAHWHRAITLYERQVDPRADVVRKLLSELQLGRRFGEGFEGGGDQRVVGSRPPGGDQDSAGGSRGLQGPDHRGRSRRERQAGDQGDPGVGGAEGGY